MPLAARRQRTPPILMLLLAVFLAMQTLAAAHAATHGLAAEPDQCSTCLRAGQYKSAVASTAAAIPAAPLVGNPIQPGPEADQDNRPLARQARAPPSPAIP